MHLYPCIKKLHGILNIIFQFIKMEVQWITGKEAVLVWAWKALHVQKYSYPIYSWNYGCQLESLIGQTVSEELKQSEAMRYVRQTLTENPYITDVKEVSVSFTNDVLSISCILNTRYGEVKVNA